MIKILLTKITFLAFSFSAIAALHAQNPKQASRQSEFVGSPVETGIQDELAPGTFPLDPKAARTWHPGKIEASFQVDGGKVVNIQGDREKVKAHFADNPDVVEDVPSSAKEKEPHLSPSDGIKP